MPKYLVYFSKEMFDCTEVEASDKEDAVEKARPYYDAINNDYYYGGDWSLDSIGEVND